MAEEYGTTVSNVIRKRLDSDNRCGRCTFDRKATYQAVMNLYSNVLGLERTHKDIDLSVIREEMLKVCTHLNS